MTRIRATCPECGEVDLAPDDLVLHVDDVPEPATTYRFACPHCETTIVKPADRRVTRLLTVGGVRIETAPIEDVLRRLVTTSGPAPAPISPDDVLDFHEFLQTNDCIAALVDAA